MTEELKVLFPEEIKVLVKETGEEILVKPFKLRKIFKVLDIIAEVGKRMSETGDEAIFEFLSHSEDKVFKVLELALDKDSAWFDNLEADTGIDLIMAVFKVNKSFFDKKVKPLLEELGFLNQKEENQEKLSNLPAETENQKPVMTEAEIEALLNSELMPENTLGQTQ